MDNTKDDRDYLDRIIADQEKDLIPIELTNETIESMIYVIRGQKVMLDFDLAKIYGYETKYLNRQVKNNITKFPEEFMFQLTHEDLSELSRCKNFTTIMQTAGAKGGRVYFPYAFTEQGIYMLMTVLKGDLATKQSIALVKAFKLMKDYIVENRPLLGTGELIQLVQTVDEHSAAIAEIRNDLKIVMNNFIDESNYNHFVILNGETLEADLAYQDIYSKAKTSIIVIDDYINIKTLQLLKSAKDSIVITVISDNKAKNSLNANFIKDSGLVITFKANNGQFHDRFIVLDYRTPNEQFYHCGASSKDAGNKITAINKLGDGYGYRSAIDAALRETSYTID